MEMLLQIYLSYQNFAFLNNEKKVSPYNWSKESLADFIALKPVYFKDERN